MQHVALAEKLFCAHFAEDRSAIDLGRDLERDTGREVCLDRASDNVNRRTLRCHDKVDTCGARHLRQTLHGTFNILASNHHQVSHFVDDNHDVWHWRQIEFFLNVGGFTCFLVKARLHRAHHGFAFALGGSCTLIEALDVAHAKTCHLTIAVFHLAHGPFKSHNGLLRIGNNRRQQMRNAIIDGEFQHLWIDHDQTAFFRLEAVEQR